MIGSLVANKERSQELQHLQAVQQRLDASLQRRGIEAKKLADNMYKRHAAAVLIQVLSLVCCEWELQPKQGVGHWSK